MIRRHPIVWDELQLICIHENTSRDLRSNLQTPPPVSFRILSVLVTNVDHLKITHIYRYRAVHVGQRAPQLGGKTASHVPGKCANTLSGLLHCNRDRERWVFIATCPTLNWFKCQAEENPVALWTHKCWCISVTFHAVLRRGFSSPRGHCSLRDLDVPLDRIFTGWGPLSSTLPLPNPHSPIFGAQPLKPGPPARGSLRPQKEALCSPPLA